MLRLRLNPAPPSTKQDPNSPSTNSSFNRERCPPMENDLFSDQQGHGLHYLNLFKVFIDHFSMVLFKATYGS